MSCDIYLRELSEEDVSDDYVDWMNNPDIVKYTESRFTKHTLDSIRLFVTGCLESKSNILYGIFLRDSDLHIGNIKLGNIHPIYKHADIGIIIGRRECWGKGYATEAIKYVTEYGFSTLDLHKIYAGAYAHNIGSIKAFQKAGFKMAYTKMDEVIFNDEYEDCVYLEMINPQHIEGKA